MADTQPVLTLWDYDIGALRWRKSKERRFDRGVTLNPVKLKHSRVSKLVSERKCLRFTVNEGLKGLGASFRT